MAIEIQELVVKIRVEEEPKKQNNIEDGKKLKEDILRECTRIIQKELRKQNER